MTTSRTAPPSILPPFYRQVERVPDQLLFAFLDINGRVKESYSYAEFLQRTTDIGWQLLRVSKLKCGDRVLLVYPPGVEMICAFFACVRLGFVPVPAYPPTSHGFQASLYKLNFIATDCGARVVLTDRSYLWSMKLNKVKGRISRFARATDASSKLQWIATDDTNRGVSKSLPEAHCDTLFLQYTSGSTNDPKGVMVTHESLLANCTAVVDHVPIGVSWLPQYHDMGLIGYYLFFALEGGTTYGFSPLDFIQRPALWFETISKYRATASSAPNFAFEYCLRPDKLPPEVFEDLDLSSLRFLMVAAEPVRPKVIARFLKTFEPHGLKRQSLFAAYGLAEYTLAVTNYGRATVRFDRQELLHNRLVAASETAPEADTTCLMSCGPPLGSTELAIVATAAPPRRADCDQVGEVWVRGPSKCRGYWQRPELSSKIFEAQLEGSGEVGWLRTGDLGFLWDGELYLCGRSKDLIIVRGMNFHPQDIEALVEQAPGIRKGCVAAIAIEEQNQTRVVVVAELRTPKSVPDTRVLNQHLVENLGVTADRFVFIPARSLPKTSSGKLNRSLTRERLCNGELKVVAQAKGETASDHAFAPLLAAFGLSGCETTTLLDAGLSSIQLVGFSQALKDQLHAGGQGDLADAVDLRVLQNIALCELFELLGELDSSGPAARYRFKRAFLQAASEQQQEERERMQRDAELRVDVAKLLSDQREPSSGPGAVFVTGGTGFFGPFLLAGLLRQTSDKIYVLVRAATAEAGLERLRDALATTCNGQPFPEGWEQRIQPLCGDLSRAHFGLSTATWQLLTDEVHTLFHNGAQVNYLSDYAALRDANVEATHTIVRLALSGRPKILNHVSTTFIFGWSVKDTLFESDTNQDMEALDFGYSQSKWVSEQIIHKAMEQGLAARIFRPALLTPSASGAGYNFDISIRLLAFMLNHRIGTTAENQVSFSPVDIAADNLVAISQAPESTGTTYHLTRDSYANMADITRILGELAECEFTEFSLEEFVPEVIKRCEKDDILFPLLDFLVRSVGNITKMSFKRYDNSNFQRVRDSSPSGRADLALREVVLGILRFMRSQEIVDV